MKLSKNDRLPRIEFSSRYISLYVLKCISFRLTLMYFIEGEFEVVEVFYKQKIPLVQDTKILELKLNQFVW